MNQVEKAKAFAQLHHKGDPVVLYNIWDAGSARAVAEAGAKALATGSWSVAAANGYGDGQQIPLLQLVDIARAIVMATDLP
ncbi:MAG: isocitrate lyase/phosphoenolpyruvate mutase family protein, partial [Pararhizobium sp.]